MYSRHACFLRWGIRSSSSEIRGGSTNPSAHVRWLTLWELPKSTRPHIMGFTFCYVSTHEAKLEVATTAGTFLILIYTKSFDSGTFLTSATSFVTDRVRTAYYVYLSHLAESTLPMCCINVTLSLHNVCHASIICHSLRYRRQVEIPFLKL